MSNKFIKDETGFTGLEAAIVLIAFVVVAAVFSYVMLGAGFFTTQKSQEVVHTGVMQASSSVEVSGDIISTWNPLINTELGTVSTFLQLTSGGSSVDISKTLIVYSDLNTTPTELTLDSGFTIPATGKYNANTDNILERGEKFQIDIDVAPYDVNANEYFQLEIKPPQGATYSVRRTAPPALRSMMTLH